MGDYIVYYDSGTSNTRIYLLNSNFEVLSTKKKNVGSKDSAIAGSNDILISGMKKLYDEVLQEKELHDEDVKAIYASGMITSPYGIKEVPHLVIPITVKDFADSLYCHFEEKQFHRSIYMILGLKTTGNDISLINNMRGEEIEIMGTLDEVDKRFPGQRVALIMPGSHTHITCVEKEQVIGICSNFTGELFHALKTSTVLAPVLSVEVEDFDRDMILKGYENLKQFGINRAIYICHAMRLFHDGDPRSRVSYMEGVLTGAVIDVLDYYCENFWQGCESAAIVSNKQMYEIYSTLLTRSKSIQRIEFLPISDEKSYALEGLKKIISNMGKQEAENE